MALRPTIYKLQLSVSDLDRQYYDTLNLTLAQHPSEKVERMMARVVAYCLNAEEGLAFSKGGLSTPDEPDLWTHALDGRLSRWIDVGEPAFDRLKKACRLTSQVSVYSFNSKSDVWWAQNREKLATLPVSVYQLSWSGIQAVASMVERVMALSVTISGDSVHVATDNGECELLITRCQ